MAYASPLKLALYLCVLQLVLVQAYASDNPDLAAQRALYIKVKKLIDRGSTVLFEQHQQQLRDYPLLPYLQYTQLHRNLSLNSQADVDKFLQDYPDALLAKRLHSSWLKLLYQRGQWRQYLKYYDLKYTYLKHTDLKDTDLKRDKKSSASTKQRCRANFARYQIGEHQPALDGALTLWTVGKSQPKTCDPLFKLLVDQQGITDQQAWQRYTLAILNHKYRLAQYVERFFTSKQQREQAKLFLSIDQKPTRVGDYKRLTANKSPEFLKIIAHAIRHLAKQNAILAQKHWDYYLASQISTDVAPEVATDISTDAAADMFDDATKRKVLTALVKGLYRQGHEKQAASYLARYVAYADTALLEWQLRNLLNKTDWQAVIALIAGLPPETGQDQRWRYWQARALLLHSTDPDDINAAKTTLRELSRFRSFYGFLASDWVDNPYSMQHQPLDISSDEINHLAALPGIRRAQELLFHEQYLDARREWYFVGKSFTSRQWQTAAHISRQWQWHGQTILAMTRAEYWDDIDLRFPLVFKKEFESHAKQQGIPLPLIFALARQESAFRPRVKSPAGARGLMQLMPATATQVASQHNIRYRSSAQLANPDLNIRLGSQYYHNMLERFGDNRILATASYNAGPHRVKRWLDKSRGNLPFDAWVEIIPFKETRHYVQSVLAFAVIYSHHLQQDYSILSTEERARLF